MSFIRKQVPPPALKEGDLLEAEIVDMAYPVEIKNFKAPQIQITARLPNGYSTRTRITYYEHPSEKSELAKVCLQLLRIKGGDFADVNEALKALKEHGKVFLKCSGHWERNGTNFPNFQLVTDKLPDVQGKFPEDNPSTNAAAIANTASTTSSTPTSPVTTAQQTVAAPPPIISANTTTGGSAAMTTCKSCSAYLQPRMKFCPHCGAQVTT